jgi:dTDP-4-dehydrorhamnose 3,5-epimerase-like enzyme
VVFEEGDRHLHIAIAHVHDLLTLVVGKLLEVEEDLRKTSCRFTCW